MKTKTIIISDQTILSMIEEKNLEAWELLYDKYAPAMYGIICGLVNDRAIADDIFKEAFIQLKEKNILNKVTYALCPCLLRYTQKFAKEQLTQRGITVTQDYLQETSLVKIFCSQKPTVSEVASNFNITEKELKIKLRQELFDERVKQDLKKQRMPHIQFSKQHAYNFNSSNFISGNN